MVDYEKYKTNGAVLYLTEYVIYFNENYNLLLDRYDRFYELRNSKENNLDTNTYFDMLIVQLRSILVDQSGRKTFGFGNYTVQNIFSLAPDLTKNDSIRIERMLNSIMIEGVTSCNDCIVKKSCGKDENQRVLCDAHKGCTMREAIKVIADKSICHYDNYYRDNREKWEYIQILRNMLYEKDSQYSVDYIIGTIRDIFRDGVSVEFEDDVYDAMRSETR